MYKIRFLTALIIIFLLCCGCKKAGSDTKETESTAPAAAVEPADILPERKTSPGGGDLVAGGPILTVNADPVYRPEFRFWLNYIGKYYKSTLGIEEITDWDVRQNGMVLEDFFLSTAVGYARKDRAIEAKAKELGIDLSEKDLARIAEKRESNIRIYGSVSEYRRIVASMYISEEVFNYLTRIDHLGNYLFEHFYGKNGELFTDREVSKHIEEGGLMCAKYIFRSNLDADGNPLPAERQAENARLLENLLGQLDASDDPLVLFSELMKTYGEDEAAARFPNGRLFATGSRETAFETACAGLKEKRYSGIVTTSAGSYIILRMPIFADMAADSAGNTLRYRAAYEQFKKQVETWSMEMPVVYEDAYYDLNVRELF
jgi:hypothetical protein